MVDCTSIVPLPGVKLRSVDVHVPRIIKVPPLLISRELPVTDDCTSLTLSLFVPPATQLIVPIDPCPMINVPYEILSVAALLSIVQVPLIRRLSPGPGMLFHLVGSLKLPGP